MWGAGLLADAAIRVVMSYTLPVSVVPALGGALWPVTFVVLQVVTNIYYQWSGALREVEHFRPRRPRRCGRAAACTTAGRSPLPQTRRRCEPEGMIQQPRPGPPGRSAHGRKVAGDEQPDDH